uniref:CSON013026 protein n=1 Tax=Culicoides sonorensis TaxID=179676 RepID=A0A336M725_CULSO
MSCFLKHSENTSINVVRFDNINNLNVDQVSFGHEWSLDLNLLPQKKVIGNKNPKFLKKRQEALEIYLQEVFKFLQLTMPKVFVEFLDFHKYDIIFILHNLAALLSVYSENFLARSLSYTFSSLEIYSISERMKLPTPSTEVNDNKYDFSHILDFACLVEGLSILPVKHSLPCISFDEYSEHFDQVVRSTVSKPLGTSSIVPEELKFDLAAFKVLKTLKIFGISSECIIDAKNIRETVENLYVQKSKVTDVKQILLCDSPVHKTLENNDMEHSKVWQKVKYANFSDNQISIIDKSINLIPKVRELILDSNNIDKIIHFKSLPLLSTLSLESNRLSDCVNLHTQLGQIETLNVAQNQIRSLKGFQKLYSLVNLDISCNLIDTIDEVDYIGKLPVLENIRLTGNPVAGSVDYRSRILSRFGERLQDIYLDNEKGSTKEIDTALALSALRISMTDNAIGIKEGYENVFCTISRN